MPLIAALPTWVAINNANNGSPTGITDATTGQPIAAGGLNLGDYFDLTNKQAQDAQYAVNGTLFAGRYRWVQVDSGATAANVRTGTVGYLRAGSSLKSVVTLTAGSGQTNGTYQIPANVSSGGGSGAIIQVIIAGGAISGQPTVVNGGFGYNSLPTFTVAAGGTPGTVVAQLNISANLVTSADQSGVTGVGAVKPVVFLNSVTPGNYGFVQELGFATVLATAAQTQSPNQFAIVKSSAADGTMTVSSATYGPFAIGNVIDAITAPLANTPFKILLTGPVVQD